MNDYILQLILSSLGEILDCTKFAFCYHDIKSFRNECIATMEKIWPRSAVKKRNEWFHNSLLYVRFTWSSNHLRNHLVLSIFVLLLHWIPVRITSKKKDCGTWTRICDYIFSRKKKWWCLRKSLVDFSFPWRKIQRVQPFRINPTSIRPYAL